MKMGNKLRRFLFRSEKMAVFEPMTERQTGQDKKSPGVLLFYVSSNEHRLILNKSVPYQNLITDHTTPYKYTPGKKPGVCCG
jgi:hypothetical protein